MTEPASDGRHRVVVLAIRPEIDAGRYPVKRVVGEPLDVEVDLVADGHDTLRALLLVRHASEAAWTEVPLVAAANDAWHARFEPARLGRYHYSALAWIDAFATWRHGFERKVAAAVDVGLELREGAELVASALPRAAALDRALLDEAAAVLRGTGPLAERIAAATSAELAATMARLSDRSRATSYARELELLVERPLARTSAWYEMFPRSTVGTGARPAAPPDGGAVRSTVGTGARPAAPPDGGAVRSTVGTGARPAAPPDGGAVRSTGPAGRHGTFRDAEARLDYVAGLGFDIVYLPPIHPIGRAFRKGPDNAPVAGPGDPGSPWAIGGPEGGHTSVHPELGTLDDFDHFVVAARARGLEVALDIAFQASPDHPWVTEHPSWFRHRPDGSIQYAENPPKKYQDVYPFDFECDDWRALWDALRDVFVFWAERGIRCFRVDNPHTKPIPFWEWCLAELRERYPDAVFLSEAFTRPKLAYALAKVGFSQSYTYFTWRTGKHELERYFDDLAHTDVAEFFRPSLWPTTPDIFPEYLAHGGRAAFVSRLVLAATLSSSYGIYGPSYELMEREPRAGAEELARNEKYQLRTWDLDRPDSLAPVIAALNRIRRAHPALHQNRSLRFHATDNDLVICYSKRSADRKDVIVTVVNLDPHHTHSAWLELDLQELGVPGDETFQVHDLLGGSHFLWRGPRNYVELAPDAMPAHVFELRRRVRSELQFEYFL